MSTIKTPEEIEILREGGKRLAQVLREVAALVAPGVSTALLNERAETLIRAGGDLPAFLGYTPEGAPRPFPAALCVSVNDAVVHGIPNEDPQVLEEGDIVGLDLGLTHRGLIVDSAVTVCVGTVDPIAKKLIETTKEALRRGIAAARGGGRVGDIEYAIGACAKEAGFTVPYELGGHGVGYAVHESPHIGNSGTLNTGEKLVAGMVLALEPIFTEGGNDIIVTNDDYTIKTADGTRSAHFEHTIVVTQTDPEILTA